MTRIADIHLPTHLFETVFVSKKSRTSLFAIFQTMPCPLSHLSVILAIAFFAFSAVAQPPPLPGHLAADAAAIIALASSIPTSGWDRLSNWVDLHGARLSGSMQLEKALDYALAEMTSDGFDNVHEEFVNVSKWTRGEESLKMISPYNKTMNFLSIGSSVGTGGVPIVAPILVVSSFDELTARKCEAIGKIVVFNYFCDWASLGGLACYEKSAGYRSVGANAAFAAGAVAVLVRSLTEFSLGTPHTVSPHACYPRRLSFVITEKSGYGACSHSHPCSMHYHRRL